LGEAVATGQTGEFRNNYPNPAMENHWIERTQPNAPRSPTQGYRLTGKAQHWLLHHVGK
jgi:hypothetical protein